jgi:hypothetical protein
MALFNWFNLASLFDTSNVNARTGDEIKQNRFKLHFEIQWREIANWKQYSVKSALWRGFLMTVLILSQFVYTSFSFLISSNPYVLTYIFFLCLALSIQLFAALVVYHTINSLYKLATRKSSHLRRPSRFPKIAIVLYALCIIMVGFNNTFKLPEIKKVNIPIKELPRHLDKMTITFVSDIHLGPTVGQRSLEQVVHMINYLQSGKIQLLIITHVYNVYAQLTHYNANFIKMLMGLGSSKNKKCFH